MKNYATRPSALPFLTSIPGKTPWAVLRSSEEVHEVHPYEKAVPADQGIGSLGIPLKTFEGKSLTMKEEDLRSPTMQASSQIYGIDG